MNIPLISKAFADRYQTIVHCQSQEERLMRKITITELRKGSDTSTMIEQGESLQITKDEKVVATYRPYREGDEGEHVDAGQFYPNASKYLNKVKRNKTAIVLKRGVPFATLCKHKTRAAKKPKKKVEQKKAVEKAPSTNHNLWDAVLVLQAAAEIPVDLRVELFELGSQLNKQGRLKQGLTLLRVLLE